MQIDEDFFCCCSILILFLLFSMFRSPLLSYDYKWIFNEMKCFMRIVYKRVFTFHSFRFQFRKMSEWKIVSFSPIDSIKALCLFDDDNLLDVSLFNSKGKNHLKHEHQIAQPRHATFELHWIPFFI